MVARLKLTDPTGEQVACEPGMVIEAYNDAMLVHKATAPPHALTENNRMNDYFNVFNQIVESLSDDDIKNRSYSLVLTMVIGIVKRGSPSEGVLKRLMDAVQLDANARPTLSTDALKVYWKGLEKHTKPETVKEFFERWITYIPESCIQVRMLVVNAKWEGLTGIVTVKDTLKKYPGFWEMICCIAAYKGELEKFKAIVEKPSLNLCGLAQANIPPCSLFKNLKPNFQSK